MDVSARIEISKLYYPLGESSTTALRGYKTKHGLIKDPFTVSTITRLIAKFESTGFVLDFPGKGRKSVSDERAPIAQNAVEQLQSQSIMASSSITQVSQLTGTPNASVHRIMRRHLHLYPYHFTLLQNITEEDKEQRVTFANWLLDNEEIVPKILSSDEANFPVDGIINKHNCVIWSRELLTSTSPIISIPLISVCGWDSPKSVSCVSFSLMLRFPATITSVCCRRMLSRNSSSTRSHRPSFNKMRTYLREQFSDEGVIARGFPNIWPARLPDLTPLDYWFWGMIKARVYHENKPKNLVELSARIEEECARVTLEEVKHAVSHLILPPTCYRRKGRFLSTSFVMPVSLQ
ncbi:hypothetical protein CLF_102867 [Clonorchis sinensis]|uniref:DUF4817 domain-containing protein n=1 Tax=Clonorchis sinensis TaxID=79923 RepID=G7Y8N8_CLOSI|nr:hypothetical protein CLF_102867 [Clonorchis sinensis]